MRDLQLDEADGEAEQVGLEILLALEVKGLRKNHSGTVIVDLDSQGLN